MAQAKFTIVIAGALNAVTLTQSSDTSMTVLQETWDSGADVSGPPSSTQSIELSDVQASGGVVRGSGPSFLWFKPEVKVGMSMVGAQHRAHVVVEGAGPEDQDTWYPISSADAASISAFLATAKFPPIT